MLPSPARLILAILALFVLVCQAIPHHVEGHLDDNPPVLEPVLESRNNLNGEPFNSLLTRAVGKVSSGDAKELLKLHNDYRAKHGAAALVWDNKLQTRAKDYGLQCKFAHSTLGHGENLSAGTGSYGETKGLFTSWTNESKDYNPSSPVASHFTQVVWKASKRLGCALIACPARSIFDAKYGEATYLICEYDPPGNVAGQYAKNVQK